MAYRREVLADLLPEVDLGNSVAEHDEILESARVETSVFSDLSADRVDLIPGTKGSGKSALFRIFTDFMPDHLLQAKRVVVAHGVSSHGDSVFLAFEQVFNNLTEDEFVDFWCIYLAKIAYRDFIQNPEMQIYLTSCRREVADFEAVCIEAGIVTPKPFRTFRDLLESVLGVLSRFSPTFNIGPDGAIEINPVGNLTKPGRQVRPRAMPKYVDTIRSILDEILRKSNLRLWLMIDRLDEIFPRRSRTETNALRGILRTLREFSTRRIVVKLFVRDDILAQVTAGEKGFTALTHITSRQADKLRWSEDQILYLIVNRFFANEPLRKYLKVNLKTLNSDQAYRTTIFYKIFPKTMGDQVPTLKWIYDQVMDGNGVVTPRDIIDMLTRAKQKQQDELRSDSEGSVDWILGPSALSYGFDELAKRKKDTLLKAEFPHLWEYIEKFEHGKTEYTRRAVLNLVGHQHASIVEDLVSIGFLKEFRQLQGVCYKIPHVYRSCLEVSPGLITD